MSGISEKRDSCAIELFENSIQDKKTIVIFGVARGGTSMVAGVVRKLGFFLGEKVPNNHEDPQMINSSIEAIKETVKSRNENYDVWGWKNPHAVKYLDKLKDDLINPVLIIVNRDIVATSKGHIRWHGRDSLFAITDIIQQQNQNIVLALRWQVPTLMVSYEKCVQYPRSAIYEIATFLNAPIPEKEEFKDIVAFMKPGKYKEI